MDADGGEAWFEEHHDEPGFFLQVLSLSDTLGMVEVMSEFDGWSDLIPFGSDGSRETFCLSRQNGHIYLVDATQGVEDAIDCGGSFAHMARRIAAGWNPFDGNQPPRRL